MPQEEKDAACVVCDQAITNPVCPECLESSMKSWLVGNRPQLIKKLEEISEAFYRCEWHLTTCVKCGQHMSVCPHCFARAMLDFVRDEHDSGLEEEFMVFFDYDLREHAPFA